MIAPSIPANEKDRLVNLKDYHILDTLPEKDFDDLTILASQICNTPISLVSLIDSKRQWFKSNHGLDLRETPRDFSFCAHAINHPGELFIISDATKDERFHDNPYVVGEPNIKFYAGVPLVSVNGLALGSLCVIDEVPRTLTPFQESALSALSRQVTSQLELRRKNNQLKIMYETLENNYRDIEQFSYIAAHDLKSPLNNIRGLIDIIMDEDEKAISADGKIYLDHVKESSEQLANLIDGILDYSRATQFNAANKENINPNELIAEISRLLKLPGKFTFEVELFTGNVYTSRVGLKQILLNLLNNAIKYLDKPEGIIKLGIAEQENNYTISVVDNGSGIPIENLNDIFDLFKAVKLHKNSGTGIGLSIVKKMVDKLGGEITVQSELGKGTTFELKIPKNISPTW